MWWLSYFCATISWKPSIYAALRHMAGSHFCFFLLNNALEWGRMFIKVVESGLKCIKVVRSGRFLG